MEEEVGKRVTNGTDRGRGARDSMDRTSRELKRLKAVAVGTHRQRHCEMETIYPSCHWT